MICVKLKSKKKLKYLARRHKRNEKYSELIELAQKRIKLYNWNVYNKIDEFKAALVDANKDYTAVNFPDSVKIPTKRGKRGILV